MSSQASEFAAEPLYWDASYAIARQLMVAHPNIDLEQITLTMIYDWVLALPSFADDPDLANDDMLISIYQDWYEEANPL